MLALLPGLVLRSPLRLPKGVANPYQAKRNADVPAPRRDTPLISTLVSPLGNFCYTLESTKRRLPAQITIPLLRWHLQPVGTKLIFVDVPCFLLPAPGHSEPIL